MRAVRSLHPHAAHPHRGQQLRPVLQEEALAQRDRHQEEDGAQVRAIVMLLR